jgi:hypothetical protein
MNDSATKPLLADIRAELGAIGGELRDMAAARWELARLEVQADLLSARRLLIAWLVAAVMALTALPLLAVCAAEALDGLGEITRSGWLLILAAGLLVLSMTGGAFAWHRFRRRFIGLQETLEELREDVAWLREKRTNDE